MRKLLKIHFDGYKGGFYEFEFKTNTLPGVAVCPICGNHHISVEKEILTLKQNHSPVCFRCKANHFDELLTESDIEFLVETEFLTNEEE